METAQYQKLINGKRDCIMFEDMVNSEMRAAIKDKLELRIYMPSGHGYVLPNGTQVRFDCMGGVII